MMKRLFAFFLTWTIIAGIAMPCYAAASIHKGADSVTVDVYARAVREIPWEEASVNNGSAVVTTDRGYVITVTGIPAEAVVLRIYPIPSSESFAWDWLVDCIGKEYNIQEAFDIYFENASGNRINADGVAITIQGYDNDCAVFSVSSRSRTAKLDHTNEKGAIRFTADGSHYYVLTKKVSAAEMTSSEDFATLGKSSFPATGDDENLVVYCILVIALGIVLMLCGGVRKHL